MIPVLSPTYISQLNLFSNLQLHHKFIFKNRFLLHYNQWWHKHHQSLIKMCRTSLDDLCLFIYLWESPVLEIKICRLHFLQVSILCRQNVKNLMHEQKEHFIDKQVWRPNPTLMKYFSIAVHLVIGENEIGLLMNPFCNRRK